MKIFGYSVEKCLLFFILVVIGYFIAKLFSQKCNCFSVGGPIACEQKSTRVACDIYRGHCQWNDKDHKCGYKCGNNKTSPPYQMPDCTKCININMDPDKGCTECANDLYSKDSGCTECNNTNLNPEPNGSGCIECNDSELLKPDDCNECKNTNFKKGNTPGKYCTECEKEKMNPNASCTECSNGKNFNPSNCSDCIDDKLDLNASCSKCTDDYNSAYTKVTYDKNPGPNLGTCEFHGEHAKTPGECKQLFYKWTNGNYFGCQWKPDRGPGKECWIGDAMTTYCKNQNSVADSGICCIGK